MTLGGLYFIGIYAFFLFVWCVAGVVSHTGNSFIESEEVVLKYESNLIYSFFALLGGSYGYR